MGVLEDAIREHLDLKRKHGASEDEVERQEVEALGPARREVAPPEPEGEAAPPDEAYEPGESAVAVGQPPAEQAPAFERPPVAEEALDEPAYEEPPVAAGDVVVEEPLAADDVVVEEPPVSYDEVEEPPVEEPPFTDPPVVAQEPPAPVAEPSFAEDEEPEDDPLAEGEYDDEDPDDEVADDDANASIVDQPTEHFDVEEAMSGDTPPQGFPAQAEPAAAENEDGDVLEDTPDFLQDAPEHDRLWFEQKPPRDFDFD